MLVELAVVVEDFGDCAKFDELGKGFVGLFGGCHLDGLAEGLGLLAADGGQLAETVGRILFENPQRIATSDGGVLAGVARHHDPAVGAQGQVKELGHVIEAHGAGFIQDNHAPG